MKYRTKRQRVASAAPIQNANPLTLDPSGTGNIRRNFTDAIKKVWPTFTANLWSDAARKAALLARQATARAHAASVKLTPLIDQGRDAVPFQEKAGLAMSRNRQGAFAWAARHHQEAADLHRQAAKGADLPLAHLEAASLHDQAAQANQAASSLTETLNYSPDEARDPHGRWTSGGSGDSSSKRNQEHWNDAEANGIFLLHGTADANLASIHKHGLDPAHKSAGADEWAWQNGVGDFHILNARIKGRKASVYLTDDPEYAAQFASAAAAVTHSRPVILKVEVPYAAAGQFKQDEVGGEHAFRFEGKIKPQWIKDAVFIQPAPLPTIGTKTLHVDDEGNVIGNYHPEDTITFYLVLLVADPADADKTEPPVYNYSPDQPRDERGRWTSGGSGGGGGGGGAAAPDGDGAGAALGWPWKKDHTPVLKKEEIEKTAKEVKDKYGYYGDITVVNQAGPHFKAGGKDWKELANCVTTPQVGKHSGDITIWDNGEWHADQLHQVLRHEMVHGMWTVVKNRYDAESAELIQYVERQIKDNVPQKDWAVDSEGLLRSGFTQKFPTYGRLQKIFRSLYEKPEAFADSDGVTPYSQAYWKDYEKTAGQPWDKRRASYYAAIHETLAEMAAVHERDGKLPGTKEWQNLYAHILTEYQRLHVHPFPKEPPLYNAGPATVGGGPVHYCYLDENFQPTSADKATYMRWNQGENSGWAIASPLPTHNQRWYKTSDGFVVNAHQKTLAVDLDGTLAATPQGTGGPPAPILSVPPRTDIVAKVQRAKDKGWRIIIWTVRDDYTNIAQWAIQHNVPYDFINYNPDQPTTSPKIIADYYADDRSVLPEDIDTVIANYSPDQARAEDGRWTSGGIAMHGTTDDHLQEILKEGITPQKYHNYEYSDKNADSKRTLSAERAASIYVTKSTLTDLPKNLEDLDKDLGAQQAAGWANNTAIEQGGKPYVLAVKVPKGLNFIKDEFFPEENEREYRLKGKIKPEWIVAYAPVTPKIGYDPDQGESEYPPIEKWHRVIHNAAGDTIYFIGIVLPTKPAEPTDNYSPDQPRVPAGSPGGGQFSKGGPGTAAAPKPGDWKNVTPRGKPPETAEKAWAGTDSNNGHTTDKGRGEAVGEKEETPKGAGDPTTSKLRSGTVTNRYCLSDDDHCNGAWHVTLDNGEEGVWKPRDEESTNLRNGVPSYEQYMREAATYAVAEAAGFADLVPPTDIRTIDGKIGSIQEWQEGAQPAKYVYGAAKYDGDEDLKRAAVFDYLIGNTDRHGGNWMLKNDKLRLIDNGLSFPENTRDFWGNKFIMDRAYNQNYAVPKSALDLEGKWPKIEKALTDVGISQDAIDLTHQRFDKLIQAAKDGKSFRDLGYRSASISHSPPPPSPSIGTSTRERKSAHARLRSIIHDFRNKVDDSAASMVRDANDTDNILAGHVKIPTNVYHDDSRTVDQIVRDHGLTAKVGESDPKVIEDRQRHLEDLVAKAGITDLRDREAMLAANPHGVSSDYEEIYVPQHVYDAHQDALDRVFPYHGYKAVPVATKKPPTDINQPNLPYTASLHPSHRREKAAALGLDKTEQARLQAANHDDLKNLGYARMTHINIPADIYDKFGEEKLQPLFEGKHLARVEPPERKLASVERIKQFMPSQQERHRLFMVNPADTWTGNHTHIDVPADLFDKYGVDLQKAFPNHRIVRLGTNYGRYPAAATPVPPKTPSDVVASPENTYEKVKKIITDPVERARLWEPNPRIWGDTNNIKIPKDLHDKYGEELKKAFPHHQFVEVPIKSVDKENHA